MQPGTVPVSRGGLVCPSGPALHIPAPLPVPFMVSAPPQPGSGRLLVVLSLHRRLRMGGSLSLLRKKANSSKGRGQPSSWGGDEGRAGCWGSPCRFRGPPCTPFLPGGSDRGDAYGSSSFPSELGDSRLSHCSLCAASLVPGCLHAEPPRLFPVPPPQPVGRSGPGEPCLCPKTTAPCRVRSSLIPGRRGDPVLWVG